MITVTGVDHINMNVKNLEQSKKFYGEVFGFELREEGFRDGGNWAIIGVPDRIYLALYEVGDAKMAEQDLQVNHFGFHVKDFEGLKERLETLGVRVDHSWDYGRSRSIYIEDPSGYEIELSEKLGGGLH
ncbi:MAG: VOC family protein [Elusimicrobia bacterium]|nr:VOC family protein [Elusimicrobiota bacterium]